MREKLKALQAEARGAAEFLGERLEAGKAVKIVSHVDADGIAAAAILARCLHYYNAPYVLKFCKPMRSEEIERLGGESYEVFIFVDQGTTQLEDIHRHLLVKGKDVLLIDHHGGELRDHPNLRYVHPHTVGVNGGRDMSASGVAYLLAESISTKFRSLIKLALVGAIGDRQELAGGFEGINAIFAKLAVDSGIIELREGLRLTGRSTRSALFSLWTSTRPYLPGLSGDIDESRKFLENLEIDPSMSISKLEPNEEAMLSDAILRKIGGDERLKSLIWGRIYVDRQRELVGTDELQEFACLLDCCADMNAAEVGFALAMRDERMVSRAIDLFETRQKEMLRIIQNLAKRMNEFREMKNFRYIFLPDVGPLMVGEAVSLMIESGMVRADKPVIGISVSRQDELKVSARGTQELAAAGFDLGKAIRMAAADIGESGGGHDVAASARIRREKLEEFLKKVDDYLGV
jgi:single-stranded-DNA-specific exonuclease